MFCGMLASLQAWNPSLPLEVPLLRKATAGNGKFTWTQDLEQEFVNTKKVMSEQIRLSPYNSKKTLNLVVDAASSLGVGFVLFQWIDELDPSKGAAIINANASMLMPDMLRKPLCDIHNKRLQKILMRVQYYNFNTHHIPGTSNKIADALSRLCGIVAKTHHSPCDNIRLLGMSKKNSEFKNLPDNCELRLIHDSIPNLGISELRDGNRLIVRNGGEVLIPKSAREEIEFAPSTSLILQHKQC